VHVQKPSADHASTIMEVHDEEDSPGNSSASPGSASISHPFLEILKSIRSLTGARTNDFRATCSRVQYQLETLQSKVVGSALEGPCILAAFVYVDLVLLQTPPEIVSKSKVNGQLQQAMMQSRTTRDLKENEDILMWISATAAAAAGGSTSIQKALLVDKFNKVLARLEGLCKDGGAPVGG
jgi:hypothetical protein